MSVEGIDDVEVISSACNFPIEFWSIRDYFCGRLLQLLPTVFTIHCLEPMFDAPWWGDGFY